MAGKLRIGVVYGEDQESIKYPLPRRSRYFLILIMTSMRLFLTISPNPVNGERAI